MVITGKYICMTLNHSKLYPRVHHRTEPLNFLLFWNVSTKKTEQNWVKNIRATIQNYLNVLEAEGIFNFANRNRVNKVISSLVVIVLIETC